MPIMDALPDMKREAQILSGQERESPKADSRTDSSVQRKGLHLSGGCVYRERGGGEPSVFQSDYGDGEGRPVLNSYSINGWHPTCRGIYNLALDDRILDYVQDLHRRRT